MTLAEFFEYMHKNPPKPFNMEARPGLADAVSKQYALYCERYPDATKEERKKFYAETREGLKDKYPTYAELESQCSP
jgi:hypothetical protein